MSDIAHSSPHPFPLSGLLSLLPRFGVVSGSFIGPFIVRLHLFSFSGRRLLTCMLTFSSRLQLPPSPHAALLSTVHLSTFFFSRAGES